MRLAIAIGIDIAIAILFVGVITVIAGNTLGGGGHCESKPRVFSALGTEGVLEQRYLRQSTKRYTHETRQHTISETALHEDHKNKDYV